MPKRMENEDVTVYVRQMTDAELEAIIWRELSLGRTAYG
jgi:hypothetical protein